MINAIIIDDEQHCLESLSIQLSEHCPAVNLLGGFPSAKTGLEAIELLKPDLVFLDIEMPVMNGFELLAQLSQISFAVVFTTSYEQYAIKAIRFSALDYLLKPVEPKELINAVTKVQEQRHLPFAEQFQLLLKKINGKNNAFTKIAIPTAEGFEMIPADEVIYCEATDNYTIFFQKKNKKTIACRSLKEIEEQLQDFTFFVRVHHSFLINLNEVSKYIRGEGGHLIMSDGSSVSVSRSRKNALLAFF